MTRSVLPRPTLAPRNRRGDQGLSATTPRGDGAALARAVRLARPVTLAHERVLPVAPSLASLFPHGGLARGASVVVGGGSGASSVALALVAELSTRGSWLAVVGWRDIGLMAAHELGVALERLIVVDADADAERWGVAVGALLDAVDVVVACPPRALSTAAARRLAHRARERGGVLVVLDAGAGPVLTGAFDPAVRLVVRASVWRGLEEGHGHLTARPVTVDAHVRREGRSRRAQLWLPGVDGSFNDGDAIAGDVPGDVATAPVTAPATDAVPAVAASA